MTGIFAFPTGILNYWDGAGPINPDARLTAVCPGFAN